MFLKSAKIEEFMQKNADILFFSVFCSCNLSSKLSPPTLKDCSKTVFKLKSTFT